MSGAEDDYVDAEKVAELWYGPRRKIDAAAGRDMAQLAKAERLARAVLMFFEPGDWSREKREVWIAMTGKEDATSKVLGDLAREVRDEEEALDAVVGVLAHRLDEINEDAGNKWVWKNHTSQSQWIRATLLPWIRDAAIMLIGRKQT